MKKKNLYEVRSLEIHVYRIETDKKIIKEDSISEILKDPDNYDVEPFSTISMDIINIFKIREQD